MKYEIPAGEHWYGGTTSRSFCPITKDSIYDQDFRRMASNQTMPFFVSDTGKYIWSDAPFRITVKDGILETEAGNPALYTPEGCNTLRDAYIHAQKKHFPCDKKPLEKEFFRVPQYNSWMEFTYYPTQEGILEYAHNVIKHGFCPGILIIDEGWHDHTGYGTWEFDRSRFPDPKAMVDELHSLGFRVMLWVTPFVTPVGPAYFRSLHPLIGTNPESAKHIYKRTTDGSVALTKWWNGESAILDFTNPWDFDFLDKQLNNLIENYGIDGFKFDGGTTTQYNSINVINGDFAGDTTPEECNSAWNEFGRRFKFHEYKDTYCGGGKNTIQRLRDRNHSWTNCGINDLIPCAVTAGLIGHPFICPDMIGGGEWSNLYTPGFVPDEELFVRIAECSALFPMMQFSWAPWNALSEDKVKICKEMADLHSRMSDEILTLVDASIQSGEPILRTLEYNDAHKGYADITDEFMLGENILVAPVITKGATKRTVVFPSGIWTDESGNEYAGGTSAELDAPLEKLLWFRKKS